MCMPHLITLRSLRQKYSRCPSQARTFPHTASLQAPFLMSKKVGGYVKELTGVSKPQHRWPVEPDGFSPCVCALKCGGEPFLFNVGCLAASPVSVHQTARTFICPQFWQPETFPDIACLTCSGRQRGPCGSHWRDVCPVGRKVLVSAADSWHTPEVKKYVFDTLSPTALLCASSHILGTQHLLPSPHISPKSEKTPTLSHLTFLLFSLFNLWTQLEHSKLPIRTAQASRSVKPPDWLSFQLQSCDGMIFSFSLWDLASHVTCESTWNTVVFLGLQPWRVVASEVGRS